MVYSILMMSLKASQGATAPLYDPPWSQTTQKPAGPVKVALVIKIIIYLI